MLELEGEMHEGREEERVEEAHAPVHVPAEGVPLVLEEGVEEALHGAWYAHDIRIDMHAKRMRYSKRMVYAWYMQRACMKSSSSMMRAPLRARTSVTNSITSLPNAPTLSTSSRSSR